MPAESVTTSTVSLNSLPPVGEQLEGGVFAGLTTTPDGKHVAVILLSAKAENVDWNAAMAWAAEQLGELPSRSVAALLYSNVKPQLAERWHWTGETDGASYAWLCDFYDGTQLSGRKSYEGCAVAVRLIPLTA